MKYLMSVYLINIVLPLLGYEISNVEIFVVLIFQVMVCLLHINENIIVANHNITNTRYT